MGFKPAVLHAGDRRRSPPVSVGSGDANVARIRIENCTTNAVEEGAEVPAEDVQARALEWCFGVSMLGR